MSKLEQALLKRHSDELSSAFSSQDISGLNGDISQLQSDVKLTAEQCRERKIIHPQMKDKKLLNLFRELRTSLNKSGKGNVILVTSIKPKSGVSFFSANLAAVIALDTSKTSVLVDCSLNDHGITKIFDLTSNVGISDFVSDHNIKPNELLNPVGIDRVRAISCGSVDKGSGEQFTHPKFVSLLEQLKDRYMDRTVVIDAPSIADSADTRILMNYCDQVVLVAPYGRNDMSDIEFGAKTIGQEKFAGVVFNDYWS